MPVLSLACHLPHNAPHIPWRYNYEQTTKQTKVINNSYIYINISCKCDTNRAGHLTLDAYASRPVACQQIYCLLRWDLYWKFDDRCNFELTKVILFFCHYRWNHWISILRILGEKKLREKKPSWLYSWYCWVWGQNTYLILNLQGLPIICPHR